MLENSRPRTKDPAAGYPYDLARSRHNAMAAVLEAFRSNRPRICGNRSPVPRDTRSFVAAGTSAQRDSGPGLFDAHGGQRRRRLSPMVPVARCGRGCHIRESRRSHCPTQPEPARVFGYSAGVRDSLAYTTDPCARRANPVLVQPFARTTPDPDRISEQYSVRHGRN